MPVGKRGSNQTCLETVKRWVSIYQFLFCGQEKTKNRQNRPVWSQETFLKSKCETNRNVIFPSYILCVFFSPLYGLTGAILITLSCWVFLIQCFNDIQLKNWHRQLFVLMNQLLVSASIVDRKAHLFTLFGDFLEIWLKFALQLDGNQL